jgi:hypothetical protein
VSHVVTSRFIEQDTICIKTLYHERLKYQILIFTNFETVLNCLHAYFQINIFSNVSWRLYVLVEFNPTNTHDSF